MSKYVTVSVKIPKELRDKLRRLGIKPSSFLRRAIEEEVRRLELERLKSEIERLRPVLERIPMEDVIRSVREDRETR